MIEGLNISNLSFDQLVAGVIKQGRSPEAQSLVESKRAGLRSLFMPPTKAVFDDSILGQGVTGPSYLISRAADISEKIFTVIETLPNFHIDEQGDCYFDQGDEKVPYFESIPVDDHCSIPHVKTELGPMPSCDTIRVMSALYASLEKLTSFKHEDREVLVQLYNLNKNISARVYQFIRALAVMSQDLKISTDAAGGFILRTKDNYHISYQPNFASGEVERYFLRTPQAVEIELRLLKYENDSDLRSAESVAIWLNDESEPNLSKGFLIEAGSNGEVIFDRSERMNDVPEFSVFERESSPRTLVEELERASLPSAQEQYDEVFARG